MKLWGILLLFTSSAFAQQVEVDSVGARTWTINPQTNPAGFQQQMLSNYGQFLADPPYYGAAGTKPVEWINSTYKGVEYINPENQPDPLFGPFRSEYMAPVSGRSEQELLDSVPAQFNSVERFVTDPNWGISRSRRICPAPEDLNYSPIPTNPPNISTPAEATRLSRYSQDPRVQRLINVARENAAVCNYRSGYNMGNYNQYFRRHCEGRGDTRKPIGSSTGYCYRYVKDALLDADITDQYYSLGANGHLHAYDAGPWLEHEGFENIMGQEPWDITDPRDAPDGAIIVYSGGTSGHIEIKGAGDEFISDYAGENPINESTRISRRVIGIYILEED